MCQFVWWNAWLFCGSDNLWAGLIKALHDAVSDHLGPHYAQAEQRANDIMLAVKLSALFIGMFIALLVFIQPSFLPAFLPGVIQPSDDEYQYLDSDSGSNMDGAFGVDERINNVKAVGSAVLGAVATVAAGFAAVRSFFDNRLTSAERIVKEASSPDFRHKLGYMVRV